MIKRLDWDSSFFEIEVGEFLLVAKNNANSENFDLLYVKNEKDFELELVGFENLFSETKVVFSKSLFESQFENQNVFLLKDTHYNMDEIYELAYESGKYSRFFLDANFKATKFQELYQKWVDNSINNTFADAVLVYQENNQTMGFVSYKINNGTATIGLIAVSPNHQGKGIGGILLKYVEKTLCQNNVKTLFIPTQKTNEAACNFYKKQGYSIHEATIIKHYWKK
jgi:dTDP-4-amino-4,6-dideoxy-D-galactose acyltransferase